MYLQIYSFTVFLFPLQASDICIFKFSLPKNLAASRIEPNVFKSLPFKSNCWTFLLLMFLSPQYLFFKEKLIFSLWELEIFLFLK